MSEATTEGRVVPTFHVGHRMHLALEHAGIGVAEMADYLEVSRATIFRWTNLVTPVRRPVLIAWAMRTGVDLDWLENGYAIRDSNPEPAALKHSRPDLRILTSRPGGYRATSTRPRLEVVA